jgi:hypothetical protein
MRALTLKKIINPKDLLSFRETMWGWLVKYDLFDILERCAKKYKILVKNFIFFEPRASFINNFYKNC